MRTLTFAKRCAKEILRDPLNLIFGLGFPLVVLLLLTAIQANVPVSLFEIQHLAPGITIFGLSFMTLFSATLVSKDRESSFLQRLYTSPLRPVDFILGYLLPMIPIAVTQCAACYVMSMALGLQARIQIVYALIAVIPVVIFQISLGLLCGSVLNTKQVGGICGALLTNLTAWLSGVWFDLSLVGETFQAVAEFFPFFHAVELERAVIKGVFTTESLHHLLVVVIYALITTTAAIFLFLRQMKKQ